jgi:ADP-ribose pyrophosphatase YjhB (NUDIX family)
VPRKCWYADVEDQMRVRAAGVILKNSSVLLVEHAKGGKKYWLLPGGGVALGEYTRAALQRELKEELNIDGKIKELLFVVESYQSPGNHILQPTFLIDDVDMENMRIGGDRRVTSFAFHDSGSIESLVIYPDIKNELKDFLERGERSERYIFTKWLD